jgi:hypothetical protein
MAAPRAGRTGREPQDETFMNDTGGSTLNDYVGLIGSLGGTAANVYGAVKGKSSAPSAPAPAKSSTPSWQIIAAIGAAVLGVILLVMVAGHK